MTKSNILTWIKDKSVSQSYSFQFSPKLLGKIKRRGLWSPQGSAEIGNRKLRFRSNGKANMHLVILDASTEQELGSLDFYWKDFQRSKLTLNSGSVFYFRSYGLLRGVWSWIKEAALNEQFVFRVDSPLHRSGTIENHSKDLSAEERDILLLLGLHLQQYINIWLMTFVAIVVAVITGR